MTVFVFIVAVITTAYGLIKSGSPWTDWLIVMPAIMAGVIAFTASTWVVTLVATTVTAGFFFLATHNIYLTIGLWTLMTFINAARGPE